MANNLRIILDKYHPQHAPSGGYDRFVELITKRPPWPPQQIAHEFGVSDVQVYNWRKQYEKEAENAKQSRVS